MDHGGNRLAILHVDTGPPFRNFHDAKLKTYGNLSAFEGFPAVLNAPKGNSKSGNASRTAGPKVIPNLPCHEN
jgi:hypothetical protein